MEDITRELKSVISEVMQDMFFMFEDENKEEIENIDTTQWLSVAISILRGENKWIELRFMFSQEIAKTMCVNFTGEETVEEELVESTVYEAVNIIGGNLLNKISLGKEYKLSIPIGIPSFPIDKNCIIYSFDGQKMVVKLEKHEE